MKLTEVFNMSIIRRRRGDDFFNTFRDMQKDVDKVFNNFLTGGTASSIAMPSTDVYETDDEYVFEFELPGYTKDDVKVNVEDNVLTVSSEKEKKAEDEKKNYHVVERCYGSFRRQFSLPDNADVDAVKAKFNNGVLDLRVPKKEEEKKKTIDVDIEEE